MLFYDILCLIMKKTVGGYTPTYSFTEQPVSGSLRKFTKRYYKSCLTCGHFVEGRESKVSDCEFKEDMMVCKECGKYEKGR
jgi:translation initiation factor 2 beta subunit (eIF-2beta)/eIF-5